MISEFPTNAGRRSNPEAPGRRVLLVEDNEAASRGLARLLELQGYSVTTAADGATALAALSAGAPPDFVVTDMQLPDLDGREIARHARNLQPRPHVGLITGWDVDPSTDVLTDDGIDWVLLKPLDFSQLISHLSTSDPVAPTHSTGDGPRPGAGA
jgi:CheY-like chemotaxis protein